MKCNTLHSIREKVKTTESLSYKDLRKNYYNIFCNHEIIKKEHECYQCGSPRTIGHIQNGMIHEFRTFGSTYSLRISERADKSKSLSFRTKYDELVREGLIL